MKLSEIDNEKVVLLLGGPRSGTSWLAKIFDSHPDVLYRHEPDTVERNRAFRNIITDELTEAQREAARAYLRRLIEIRTLKTAGSLPVFRKRYHSAAQHAARNGIIYGLRVVEKATRASAAAKHFPVPDMVDFRRHPDLRVVIKSVSSRGRVRLFAEALPGVRIIFIVRDPFGQIASMIRGAALGKFGPPAVEEVLGTDQARRYGLSEDGLKALPPIEQFAWHWAVLNEKAIQDLENMPSGKVLRYQDLCSDPAGVSRSLFDFAGLSWNPQTAAFIEKSTHAHGPDRYYQVFKDPSASLNKWRNELPPDDQRRILDVVRRTSMWPYCSDAAACA